VRARLQKGLERELKWKKWKGILLLGTCKVVRKNKGNVMLRPENSKTLEAVIALDRREGQITRILGTETIQNVNESSRNAAERN
jgi:hypothetical protein